MTECPTLDAPEPVFAEPWHAQVFALTVHLNEAGQFTWAEWVALFSQTLVRHGLSKELDGGEDYFNAWLETLETILDQAGAADPKEVEQCRFDWEQAYLTTPHGAAVRLVAS